MESPDVDENLRKIKGDKNDLIHLLEKLMFEIRDLSYGQFKQDVKKGIEDQGEFDLLRNQERKLNLEIKQINEDMKKAQDSYAQEANENNKEILRLKQQLNESKTDSELYIQYEDRHAQGHEMCVKRLYDIEESKLEKEIKRLERQIATEEKVSKRIKDYYTTKANHYNEIAEDREKLREEMVEELKQQIDQKENDRQFEEEEIQRMQAQIEQEEEMKRQMDEQEAQREADLERQRLEKIAQDNASRYVQWKWEWFNQVGRAWVKKKKRGKGKKKKGKK